ncbi:hypothetical protein I4U23_005390 [Adineta vaga]|nr:hypothetical protein I4U23_005390 [Adineta vaga]
MFPSSSKRVEERQAEITKSVNEAYAKFVPHKVRKVILKNILLIGRTRTGKSTIQSVLVDPRKIGAESTLYAQTKVADFQSYIVEGTKAERDQATDPITIENQVEQAHNEEINTNLENIQEEAVTVLNIIDTPGLFEHGSTSDNIQDNETILDTIQTCINREITKFHLVCFCASFESGINNQDIESLKLLINFLGKDVSKNSCLIITRCESKDKTERDKLVKEIVHDIHFKDIASYFQKGIHFSGVLNRDNWIKGQKDTIEDQFETICGYRADLINLFSTATDPFEIKNCDFTELQKILKSREELLEKIEKLKQQNNNNNNHICVIS